MSGKGGDSALSVDDSASGESLVIIEYKYHHGLKEKRKRTKFSAQSQELLEKYYMKNPLPNTLERTTLSTQLGLSTRCIQVWFQNRRVKERRILERSSSSAVSPSAESPESPSETYSPQRVTTASVNFPALSSCSSSSVYSPLSSSSLASTPSNSISASHSAPFLSPSSASSDPDTKQLTSQSEGSFLPSRFPAFSTFESLAWSRRGSLYGFDEPSLRLESPQQLREENDSESLNSPSWKRASKSFSLGSSTAGLATTSRALGTTTHLPRLSSLNPEEVSLEQTSRNKPLPALNLPSISSLIKRKRDEENAFEPFPVPRQRSSSFSLPEPSSQTYVRSQSVSLPTLSFCSSKEPNPFADFGNFCNGDGGASAQLRSHISGSNKPTDTTSDSESTGPSKRKSSIFDLLSSSNENVPASLSHATANSSSSPTGSSCRLTSTTASFSSPTGPRLAFLPPLSAVPSTSLPPVNLSSGPSGHLKQPPFHMPSSPC